MSISGRKIALILSDHFDAEEFNELHNCLTEAGAFTAIVGADAGQKFQDWSRKAEVTVGISFEEAHSYGFDAIIISDGYSPDEIRMNDAALSFVKDMYDANKVVGAIHHGAQVFISLGILKGKNVTSWPSIAVDLENAGATYFDEPVVIDGNLITGRRPADIRAFCNAIIDELERLSEAAA
ncbi:MAG: DJ-1/PfpI family protein [Actinobacteria bacterium]|nr:DJ-1/PfpI family protein [Actinomycetota bacterium]